jgi:hypothetical protein
LRGPCHAGESGRRDADDRVRTAGDLQSAADCRRTRPEPIAPERVADDDGAVATRRAIFIVVEEATALRCNAKDVEVARAHRLTAQELGAVGSRERKRVSNVRGQLGERALRPEQRLEFQIRPYHVDLARTELHGHPQEQRHQLLGLTKRERTEQRGCEAIL